MSHKITRRTAAQVLAMAATASVLGIPVQGSADGKVAALAERRAELSAAILAADARADDLFQTIPADISDTSQTVRHGIKTYTAYTVEDLAAIYDAKIQMPYASEIIEWVRGTTGEVIQSPSTYAKAYRVWLAEERARAISEMQAAKARLRATKDKFGVTQAEAEAERNSKAELDVVNQMIETPSGGFRDLLAKASLLETPYEPGNTYVWHSEMLESLCRDLKAMGA